MTLSDLSILAETLELLEWSRLCDHLATFASTKIGAMACRQWSPWVSQEQTEYRLTQTDEAVLLENSQAGGFSLQGIHDLLPYLERAQRGGALLGRELQEVASTLKAARKVRRTIDDLGSVPTLQDLVDTIRTYPEIEQAIFQSLEDDGSVRDTASDKLRTARKSVREVRSHIQTRLQRILGERGQAVQEAVITQRDGRYVLPVKATHKDVIRGVVHDSSSTGATLFVEPYSIVGDNNQLRQLQSQIRAEEQRVLKALSDQVGSVTDDLEHLQAVMMELDVALARARYSWWLEGNRPQFVASGLKLRHVQHPLLLWQHHHEEQQAVVPVDFKLYADVTAVVITGPNTGGKTVTLKTLGLLVLMAKAGVYLPAKDPVELPWFDRVFADIGDEQSLQQNLSTFSGHIRRIGRILEQLQSGVSEEGSLRPDLVLLDEVGAGTDPTEGAALARALLEQLAQTALLTVATTHYGELKSLKYESAQFENASVEFNEATLAPTYRLLWGIPGRSNALAIAERLTLSSAVVERARIHLQGETDDVNTVIEGLEKQRAVLEVKTQEVEALHRELESLQQEMEGRSQSIAEREAALQDEQAGTLQSEIQSARDQVAAVIRRLQKGEMSGQAAQKATAALDQLEQKFQPDPEPTPPTETEFFPVKGDRIRLLGLNQIGEVTAINGDEFTVKSGLLKFTVGLHQIAPIDEHHEKQRQRPKPPPTPAPKSQTAPLNIRTSRNTVDLRGRTVADAEALMEQALAEASSGPLWLIHGHGTGRLRTGVHQYLKAHPRVTKFTAADPEDGGTGATVATVK